MNNKRTIQLTSSALLAASLLFTSACSNTSNKMVVSPDIVSAKSSLYQNKVAYITIADMRTDSHIIEIIKKDKAAELISNANDLVSSIKAPTIQAFTRQGLVVNSSANNQLSLMINDAKLSVNQSLTKYQSTSLITLTAQLTSGEKTLTKTFKSKGTSNGVLTADLAVLERDFNQQLGKLLVQISKDVELHSFMQ